MPSSPAYYVFVSQLIRYVKACSKYGDLLLELDDVQVNFSHERARENTSLMVFYLQ